MMLRKLTSVLHTLTGDTSGLWGDCSGLWGNLDDCEIIGSERATGINIADLVAID